MKVGIFGGSGFVGRVLAHKLLQQGHTVRVISRSAAKQQSGEIEYFACDMYEPSQRRDAVRGQDAVINLVGILQGNAAAFWRAHVELAEGIAQACRDEGVPVLLHMSALHAAPDAPSMYLRSKGEGVARVHALGGAGLRIHSFHPSVIFGTEDSFLNQFAALLRLSPGIMLLPGAQARFAPVYVGDVADTFIHALSDAHAAPQINLCGPKDYSLQELVELTATWSNHKRMILPMPEPMARMVAMLMSLLPNPPLSTDNLDSMRVASVCGNEDPKQPTALDDIAPQYLAQKRAQK